jgi:L-ascorbate metabolism protein UlaG (beta-lactamase superfamily)
MGFAESIVLAPWTSLTIKGAKIVAVPGVHNVFEVGFVVSTADRAVYFAGDTRLFDGLADIAERLTPTMAILPVDGTRLRGGGMHVMTPDDAAAAAKTLRVKAVMPSHAEAHFSDPLVKKALATTVAGANDLFARTVAASLPGVACHQPAPGELVTI